MLGLCCGLQRDVMLMECCFGEQMHHTLGSPLLLCDSCPRAVHMACLELDYAALPPGDWACPKCTEKGAKAANQFRRASKKDQ